MTTRARRRGLALVEVLIAAGIVAAGLVPMIEFYRQSTHVAHFNEFHLLARYRARHLVEGFAALDFDDLVRLAGPGAGAAAPSPLPLPSSLAGAGDDGNAPEAHLAQFKGKLQSYEEQAFFELLDPEGFGRVVVLVSWRLPGEPPSRPPHGLRHFRFVSLGDASLHRAPPFG